MIQMSFHSLAFPGSAYFVRVIANRPVQSLDAIIKRRDPTSRQAVAGAPKIHCHSLNAAECKGESEVTRFPAPYKVSHPLYELRTSLTIR